MSYCGYAVMQGFNVSNIGSRQCKVRSEKHSNLPHSSQLKAWGSLLR